ncbi:hypothetical protein KR054_009046, partial [Drosophila jambulina]
SSMLEILRANLLPEIQHEILHVPISTVAELRKVVQTRERFLQSMPKFNSHPSRPVPRRQVQELMICKKSVNEIEDSDVEDGELAVVKVTCWNCGIPGHIYQECIGEKRDYRPYAHVTLLGRKLSGLMDTGASINCIGGQFAKDLMDMNVGVRPVNANVRTADGGRQPIGRITTDEERGISSVVNTAKDYRPYAHVTLLGRKLSGLMDTGASINCIGGQFAKDLMDMNVGVRPVNANVRTADGGRQPIGRITT